MVPGQLAVKTQVRGDPCSTEGRHTQRRIATQTEDHIWPWCLHFRFFCHCSPNPPWGPGRGGSLWGRSRSEPLAGNSPWAARAARPPQKAQFAIFSRWQAFWQELAPTRSDFTTQDDAVSSAESVPQKEVLQKCKCVRFWNKCYFKKIIINVEFTSSIT